MTINLSVPQTMQELRPRITVVGVGGAGGNAVNNMISADLDGVDFLVANTDGQALAHSLAGRKIQLGTAITQGLGAGSKPDVGRAAAEESIEAVMSELADCNMVFITAGMGGGTGTGAAPVIARAARERGILTVGVVTKPFDFEGQRRMAQAETGIEEMQSYVDTLIVIPNQNLFRLANERTTFADAFHMADTVLHQGVAGVTDLMIKPGQINLDFADIRAVMSEMGKAMMGTGEASGESRATQAAEAAINNPLLDDISMQGARAVLINVTGGMDMTLFEVDEAANRIRREIDSDAVIIFGSTFDEKLDGVMRVSIVATGIEALATNAVTPSFTGTTAFPKSSTIITPAASTFSGPAATRDEPATVATTEAKMETTIMDADEHSQDVTTTTLPEMPEPPQQGTAPSEEDGVSMAVSGDDAKQDENGSGEDYIPAFVATKKTSRLAFLATGKPVRNDSHDERGAPAPGIKSDADRAASTGDDSNDGQMSLDEAIARERAAAIEGDTAPTSVEVTADTDTADASSSSSSLVGDTPQAVAPAARKPFVPAAAAALPEAESIPETAELGNKTSLINKISGLWTGKPAATEETARVEPAVETPAAMPADSTPSILDLPRANVVAAEADAGTTATIDRPVDDLEIPAFLRRQAN